MATPAKRPSLDLQSRDLALLRGLFESRLITQSQIARLYFGGRSEGAKKRLQALKRAGLVGMRKRRPYESPVLHLTRKAFAVLRDRGAISDYPGLTWSAFEKRSRITELTLAHELEVMDVKVALSEALVESKSFELVEFSTWPLLFQFHASPSRERGEILVKPDGFIRIHEQEPDGGLSEHLFFLELDRSTDPQETLAQRAACYGDYYRSGGLAEKYGQDREDYKDFPFRVLMIFKNDERRNNTAERMLLNDPPVLTQVWLSTLGEVKQDPLGAIWIRPVDYRDAVENTAFDPEVRRDMGMYRRQPEREALVENEVRKSVLMTA